MTNEELITGLRHIAHTMERNGHSYYQHVAEDAIKALEQQPCEDCISRRATIDAIYKKHVGGKDAIENAPINDLYACGLEEAVDAVENMPSVTPQIEPCEDCISRQKALDCFEQTNTRQGAKYAIETLPSVTPTSEDIKEAYIKGYDYGVKDWFKSKTQPCEDCISRKMAVEAVAEALKNSFVEYEDIAKKIISKLPSVTPQRLKGKWIDVRVIKSFHYDGEPRVRCSRCGNEEEWSSNYCPNCGAEMSGGEEADD